MGKCFDASVEWVIFFLVIYVVVKFIYSEKSANFCKISTVDLSYVVTVKSTVEISQNFVAFLEYMNFTTSFEFQNYYLLHLFNQSLV